MSCRDIKVSVIIPFYEHSDWLLEAINSAINQSHPTIEIIVINDCSEENIDELKEIFNESVIFKDLDKNRGAAAARNLGLKLSTGDYIAFLDSDDLWEERKIEFQLKYMLESRFVWSHHSYYIFYKNDISKKNTIDCSDYIGDVINHTFVSFKVQTSTFMIKSSIIKANQFFFPEDFRSGQDIEFFKDIASKYPLGFVSEARSYFRRSSGSTGFKPSTQLKYKSMVYEKFLNNGYPNLRISRSLLIVYAYIYFFYSIVDSRSLIRKAGRFYEYICGLIYFPPYLYLKFLTFISRNGFSPVKRTNNLSDLL